MRNMMKILSLITIGLVILLKPATFSAVDSELNIQLSSGHAGILTVPNAVNLGEFQLSTERLYREYTLDRFVVQDLRGTGEGWSVSVTATPFQEIGGSLSFNADALILEKPSAVYSDYSGPEDVTITSTAYQPIINQPYTILSAATNTGLGTYSAVMGTLKFDFTPPSDEVIINPSKITQGLPTQYKSTITWSMNFTP